MPRAKKPSALERLQGNPGKRPINKREPKPLPSRPLCPSYLSKTAKREWRRLAPVLHKAGILTFIDRDALAMYCETLATWIGAMERVNNWTAEEEGEEDRDGMVHRTKRGNLIQNPYLGIANSARKEALSIGKQLGLTPSSRASLVISQPGDDRSLADILFDGMDEEAD